MQKNPDLIIRIIGFLKNVTKTKLYAYFPHIREAPEIFHSTAVLKAAHIANKSFTVSLSLIKCI